MLIWPYPPVGEVKVNVPMIAVSDAVPLKVNAPKPPLVIVPDPVPQVPVSVPLPDPTPPPVSTKVKVMIFGAVKVPVAVPVATPKPNPTLVRSMVPDPVKFGAACVKSTLVMAPETL
jgi:hypothetical protein